MSVAGPSAPESAGQDPLVAALRGALPASRVLTGRLERLAWGTDASFYRLVPRVVVVVETEAEVAAVLAACRREGASVTFRGAGTSLSGQTVTASVLAVLGEGWKRLRVESEGLRLVAGPGVVGAEANRALAKWGRRIGPDPASISVATLGGIVANNSSGMCCGTAQNAYRTMRSLRLMLADGTVVDTGSVESRAALARARPELLEGLAALRREVLGYPPGAERIREKYRIKNTTGYGLNALVEFEDPVEILARLMVGSEGTLGFVSEVVLDTVPDPRAVATALVVYEDAERAALAVQALAACGGEEGGTDGVAAVELIDRAGLRALAGRPGTPDFLAGLPDGATALLVEVAGGDEAALSACVASAEAALGEVPCLERIPFTGDPVARARLWKLRKDLFPLVGALRPVGTTVIIEDVAFPVARLAEGVVGLQDLFAAHGYTDAIVFGHALAGNLHIVFAQGFEAPGEVARYARFMDDLATLVVDRFDGSLKAEHGTGRNMAPYVEREWGTWAYRLMVRIKQLLDPDGVLNAGVVINRDRQVHLKDLKPLPAAGAEVDRCTECGFCETACPSYRLTLSPRQRIVGWRAIAGAGLEGSGEGTGPGFEAGSGFGGDAGLREAYGYAGLDTCAACGLCSTVCPLGIDTGSLVRRVRGEGRGPWEEAAAGFAARHMDWVTAVGRMGLRVAGWGRAFLGESGMQAVSDAVRGVVPGLPSWRASMPGPGVGAPAGKAARKAPMGRVVYFPSCVARTMGPGPGDGERDPLPVVFRRLLEKAGFEVVVPEGVEGLCCGLPFASKGLGEVASGARDRLRRALDAASRGGRDPMVTDTSPCAWWTGGGAAGEVASAASSAPVGVPADPAEFLHDAVLPRLTVRHRVSSVAVHGTCSGRKLGTGGKLAALAAAVADRVVVPEGVGCCGFAGDKGFLVPELSAHALRGLAPQVRECAAVSGVSTSRTCEIGLSDAAGVPYRSIAHFLDELGEGPG